MNSGVERFVIAKNRADHTSILQKLIWEGRRGINACHYKQLLGNPGESGHPGKLDIQQMTLFTNLTLPHKHPWITLNKKRTLLSLSFCH